MYILSIILITSILVAYQISPRHAQIMDQLSESEFVQIRENLTVIEGNKATFPCVVKNKGPHHVAWIKMDTGAILTVHEYVKTRDPRISITYDTWKHPATWKLQLSNVRFNDSGNYACKLNTIPMKTQITRLIVKVRPEIDISETSPSETVIREGGNITLRCTAKGVPEPNVQWRRDDAKHIVIRNENDGMEYVERIKENLVHLNNIQRSDMAVYLCIASNGVPPSASMKIYVNVTYSPTIEILTPIFGTDSYATIRCIVEGNPKSINTWFGGENNKLYNSEKYDIIERQMNATAWEMTLIIKNLHKSDFGHYICVSENEIGKSSGIIFLEAPNEATTTKILSDSTAVKDVCVEDSITTEGTSYEYLTESGD